MDADHAKEPLMRDYEKDEDAPRDNHQRTVVRLGLSAAVILLLLSPMALFPAQMHAVAMGCHDWIKSNTRQQAQPVQVEIVISDGSPALMMENLQSESQRQHRVQPRADSPAVCTTDACKSYAKSVLDAFAKNYTAIDPCEDFSTYVCQGWRDSHDYRADQSSVSTGSVMQDNNRNLLHAILDAPYSELNTSYTGKEKSVDEANFGKLKRAYDTCMNQDVIRKYGVHPLKQLLDDFDRIYPLKENKHKKERRQRHRQKHEEDEDEDDDNDDEDDEDDDDDEDGDDDENRAPKQQPKPKDLTDALVWLAKNGVGGFVSDYVSMRRRVKSDDKDPDLQVISIGSGETGLPSKEYYNKTETVANYTRTISQMFEIINSGKAYGNDTVPVPKSGRFSLDWSSKIVALEKRMAYVSPDPDAAGKPEYYYKPIDVSSVDKLVPEISVTRFLKEQAPSTYKINRVILSDQWYYGNLSSILKETPRETIHSYLRWNIIRTWYGRLHKDYTRPLRAFSNRLSGRDEDAISDRWRTCISEVDNISGGLGWLLSSVYVERAFTPQDKALGDRIITDIRAEFVARLQNFDWMSANVKASAEKKVKNVFQKIGYPTASPNVLSPNDLEQYYAQVNVTPNYFENGRQYVISATQRSWNDLLAPTDRARWQMSTPTINAYYNPPLNEIVFPAGILQMPVFSGVLPQYVSYGAFGSVAGHELTHGFDDNGSKYDETGRLNEWWDNTTRHNFNDRAQCFVEQFGKYSITTPEGEKLYVNGKLTQGENIADAGGISAAFSAWQRRYKEDPASNARLPGLEKFTPEQMFFVSYSNWWCGKVRPAQAVNYIYTDPHSPDAARIMGTLSNSAGFREAFNCPVKKPTCTLW